MPLKDVLAHVDADELVDLTRELVRIPSVVRPGDPGANESAVADYVHRWLVKEGFDVEVQDVAPGRPNVLAMFGEKGARLLSPRRCGTAASMVAAPPT